MTVNHDAVSALPTSGNADKVLLRNLLVKRMAYDLADTDDSRNLVAIDPSTGVTIIDILFLGRIFHYDPTDTTTAYDGTTCLVSADGLRYKLAEGVDVFAYSVLDNTIATPPDSPSVGDAYLVAAAATGAWAGKTNDIAVLTNRGWEFVNFSIGRLIYVESTDSYYHKNSAGAWVAGFGTRALGASSVPLSSAINFGAFVRVENQTTTSPPSSPTVGAAYIIGPAATGAWSGDDGKVAVCEVAGEFTIYTPGNGWMAYDKAQNTPYTFEGTTWSPSAGAWIGRKSVFSAGGSASAPGGNSNGYAYSATTPPTTSQRRVADTSTDLTYTAKKTGATLRFTYNADCEFAPGTSGIVANQQPVVLALFRDTESNAIAWKVVGMVVDLLTAGTTISFVNATISDTFEIAASDANSHTYEISIMSGGHRTAGQSTDSVNLTRRLFSVQEAA